ncbi:MAG: DUF4194 domain-containing protein [Polaromonas sp.]
MSHNEINEIQPAPDAAAATHDLSALIVPLLRGVIYQETDAGLWHALGNLQHRVRDYVAVMGLELVLDEAEGYAFLKSRPTLAGDNEEATTAKLPRLIVRRPLPFAVSLLLALLRKKLAEFDASGGDTRLIVSRDQVVEMIRVFLPDSSNEARLVDQIDTHLNKVIELGFLRKLKPGAGAPGGQAAAFEVRRILKAFVDAQWLADFDERLEGYRKQLQAGLKGTADE